MSRMKKVTAKDFKLVPAKEGGIGICDSCAFLTPADSCADPLNTDCAQSIVKAVTPRGIAFAAKVRLGIEE